MTEQTFENGQFLIIATFWLLRDIPLSPKTILADLTHSKVSLHILAFPANFEVSSSGNSKF